MSQTFGESRIPRPDPGAIPVLDGIRVTWEWLCARPHPVTVAGTEIDGVADRPIPLDELRARMLDRGTDPAVRDAVWAYLITRSRRDGPTWTMTCAGMALPMLAAVCRELTHRFAGDRADVCSAIVTGFVAALAEIDLDRPGLVSSLRWSAVRAGHASVREALGAPVPHPHDQLVRAALTGAAPSARGHDPDRGDDGGGGDGSGSRAWESAPPPSPGGHPDLVLADAVAAGVITAPEAALIGRTRLESTPLVAVAARMGRPVGAVTMQRLRAEMRLVDYLLYPDGHDTTSDDTGDERALRSKTAQARAARPVTTPGRPGDAAAGTGEPTTSSGASRSVTSSRRRRRTRGGARTGEQVTR